MNENDKDFFKIGRFWLIVSAILIIWGVCGTVSALYYRNECKSTAAIIDAAGGDEFVKLIEQHNDTAIGVFNNNVAARGELQTAIERGDKLEQQRQRAYELAELTNGEFVAIRNAMANDGITLKTSIALQQRIIDHVGRAEKYNILVTEELKDSP